MLSCCAKTLSTLKFDQNWEPLSQLTYDSAYGNNTCKEDCVSSSSVILLSEQTSGKDSSNVNATDV